MDNCYYCGGKTIRTSDPFKEDIEGEFVIIYDIERNEWIRWNILALEDELHEALAETGWKPWATSKHINREAYASEIVDAFHFFMNLMLVVDISVDELLEKYFEKRGLNEKRQSDGYDGVSTKCPVCKRAFDDVSVLCTPDKCAF